jgi:hypothetical protein
LPGRPLYFISEEEYRSAAEGDDLPGTVCHEPGGAGGGGPGPTSGHAAPSATAGPTCAPERRCARPAASLRSAGRAGSNLRSRAGIAAGRLATTTCATSAATPSD